MEDTAHLMRGNVLGLDLTADLPHQVLQIARSGSTPTRGSDQEQYRQEIRR